MELGFDDFRLLISVAWFFRSLFCSSLVISEDSTFTGHLLKAWLDNLTNLRSYVSVCLSSAIYLFSDVLVRCCDCPEQCRCLLLHVSMLIFLFFLVLF